MNRIIYFLFRLQRAQEERTRRNTNRYYDESMTGNDMNNIYAQDTRIDSTNSLSSSYIPNNSSTNPQNTFPLNSYVPSSNIMATVSSSTPTHMTYFPANPVLKFIK